MNLIKSNSIENTNSLFTKMIVGKSTRALLRKSVLIDKIIELKSRKYNTEISQLAESAYNNLQVRPTLGEMR